MTGGTTVPRKQHYRIGEACKALDIQPYVLRYWETEFEALGPGKSKTGQRVYTEEELGVIRRIKELLYEEGYTIAGAKKRLQAEIEEGRVFGALEDELFAEDAGDEPPVIAVDADREEDAPDQAGEDEAAAAGAEEGGGEESAQSRGETVWSEPEEGAEAGVGRAAAPPREQLAAGGEEEAEPPAPAVRPLDAEPVEQVSAGDGTGAEADREDSGAFEPAAGAEGGPEKARASRGRRRGRASATRTPAPASRAASAAVDSALSERVETLENGLRRVLGEVRQLRSLLADSGEDR